MSGWEIVAVGAIGLEFAMGALAWGVGWFRYVTGSDQ